MTSEQFNQLYEMTFSVGGLLLILAQILVARGGIANKALAKAVDAQSRVDGIMDWQKSYIEQQTQERVRCYERSIFLQDALDKERKRNLDLEKQIAKSKHENKAALEKMKLDSDTQIEGLNKQIRELQTEMTDVKRQLDEAIEAKKQLQEQKDAAVMELNKRIDDISRDLVKLQRDMSAMRQQYEDRIAMLQREIEAKDEEIRRLKARLEMPNEGNA